MLCPANCRAENVEIDGSCARVSALPREAAETARRVAQTVVRSSAHAHVHAVDHTGWAPDSVKAHVGVSRDERCKDSRGRGGTTPPEPRVQDPVQPPGPGLLSQQPPGQGLQHGCEHPQPREHARSGPQREPQHSRQKAAQ